MKFLTIDFETANSNRFSPCAVGLVKVEDFKIIEQKAFLIRPKDNYFDSYNTYIHGITSDMVENEPEFDVIYEQILSDITDFPLIAHNAAFDISVLRHTLDLYGIDYPETEYTCTYQMAKQILNMPSYKLNLICEYYGFDLQHHDALSDAEGCARIALEFFKEKEINSFEEISQKLKLRTGKLYKGGYKPSLKKHVRTRVANTNKKTGIEGFSIDPTKFIEDHLFFGQLVVFTGALQSMERKIAQFKVMQIGGNCSNTLTKKTNFLVVGDRDYEKYTTGKPSKKLQLVEKYVSQGIEIEVLTESQFLEMIDNN